MIPKGLLKIGIIEEKKEHKHLIIEKVHVKIAVQWDTIENSVLKDREK
jgi:hypothetical protein